MLNGVTSMCVCAGFNAKSIGVERESKISFSLKSVVLTFMFPTPFINQTYQ